MPLTVDRQPPAADLRSSNSVNPPWYARAGVRQRRRGIAQPTSGEPRVRYKIATTLPERLAAAQLVYQKYLAMGLTAPHPAQLRVLPHHLLASTNVFIARAEGEVTGTVTLVADDALGLPLETVYPAEVAQRRQAALVLGEVSCLTLRDQPLRQLLPTLIGLTRLMAQYARRRGIHELLIAAHPTHGRFYERFMGFTQIGPERTYPAANHHPAVAYSLDFTQLDRRRPACFDQYFGQPIDPRALQSRPISARQRAYFRRVLAACEGGLSAFDMLAGGASQGALN
jgi:hypothetical protein